MALQKIRTFLRIWSHLLKKPLMENFIFCAVWARLKLPIRFFLDLIIINIIDKLDKPQHYDLLVLVLHDPYLLKE